MTKEDTVRKIKKEKERKVLGAPNNITHFIRYNIIKYLINLNGASSADALYIISVKMIDNKSIKNLTNI